MRRVPTEKRPNATRLLQMQGLVFCKDSKEGDANDEPYWPDDRYYSFTSEETTLLEKAATDVFDMCCEAADYLVEHPEMITGRMAVPAFALKQIKESWDREPAWGSVYGRFDFCFGGLDHPDPQLRTPKCYEFNADTPTSIIESGSCQWWWMEQKGEGNDQLNSIYEKLVDAWKRNLALVEEKLGHRPKVHFATGQGEPSGEDAMSTLYISTACQEAGYETKRIYMEHISLSKKDGRFYDLQGEHIDVIFKLYPWEWMVEQKFGEAAFKDMETVGQRNEAGGYIGGTIWFEPPYKMLWSNKALMAVLWSIFKDDPRSQWLLPTYFEDEAPQSLKSFARKPIFSREGWGVTLEEKGKVVSEVKSDGYGKEGYIVQELAMLPAFENEEGTAYYPLLGLWMIDGEVGGMGIREDKSTITGNASVFIPHTISDGPVKYERKPVPDVDEIEAGLKLERLQLQDKSNGVLEYIGSVVVA
ncbi:Uu.00g113160.m01.CDS01 [Anthostomella pinea]|uniref:Uu.00g113160.m01.CDS01 n=1 Tax=Anthostomella pinea TaxID=933095 RepID=A0AAI8VA98_9PEZI|nr:Uu.00g113160.m01.CDS01 [Anthostomella pinea]